MKLDMGSRRKHVSELSGERGEHHKHVLKCVRVVDTCSRHVLHLSE